MRIVTLSTLLVIAMTGTAFARIGQEDPLSQSINHTLSSDAEVSHGETGSIPPLPLEIKTEGNITYVSGGVSDEELAMLKDRGNDFNLHLLAASTKGEYLSGLTVYIFDAAGTDVLKVEDVGPYFYANLPSGKYKVEVTHNGEGKTLALTLKEGKITGRDLKFAE